MVDCGGAVGGNKQNRQVSVLQLLQDVQSRNGRHFDIHKQQGCGSPLNMPEGLFGGSKCLNSETFLFQKIRELPAVFFLRLNENGGFQEFVPSTFLPPLFYFISAQCQPLVELQAGGASFTS